MSFFVDIVTEDSFYENLTLGVVKILENSPCVRNVLVERRNACDRNSLTSWEQRHCCVLPDDLRNFYSSIDGFLLTWSFEVAGEEFPVGRCEIGTLSALKRFLGSKEQQAEADANLQDDPQVPSFSTRCKLFEIGQCSSSKVFLTYVRPDIEPGVWLYRQKTDRWYQLADSFTKYFRMMLVHLGLSLWQYCAVGLPLPTWIEQIYFLVGPHLLPETVKPTKTVSTSLWVDGPLNTIDSSIFKGRENKAKNLKKK
ncbi:tubulin polyglutamylase complex subunit 2 [Orussus abietinus]|uniref:tubulin polyglutamylase complex subunit 2 n=1 Tax=Orussus abietinus TaxID=222816 RepID=UPI000626A393|nr:tubulin polyglutamylase complex subunit 2 [Orussus abietinus]